MAIALAAALVLGLSHCHAERRSYAALRSSPAAHLPRPARGAHHEGATPVAQDYYVQTGASLQQLVEDQQLAGALLRVLGDVTMLCFLIGFIPR